MKTNNALEKNMNSRYDSKQIELTSGFPFDRLYGFKLQCSAGGCFVIDKSLITFVSPISQLLLFTLFL